MTASVVPGLPNVAFSSVAWGDYDNDGRLDFLLTGSNATSRLYRNTGTGAGVNSNRPQVTDAQAPTYTPERYLAGSDGWNPIF